MADGPADGPARNRVTPWGDIVSVAARGAWTGNRGRLHEGRGARDVVRTHQTKAWITCVLAFRGRRIPQWEPGHYTPLFLLDEAVALAAGHRPCAECRRADFNAFRVAWGAAEGAVPRAPEMDAQLHEERGRPPSGRRRFHELAWADLPDGVFVVDDVGAGLVVDDHVAAWEAATYGYGEHRARPRSGPVRVLTPPASVAVLRAGYPVQVDDSAR